MGYAHLLQFFTVEKNEVYNQKNGNGNDGEAIDLDWGVSNSISQYNYTHANVSVGELAFQFSFGSAPTWHDNQYRFNISQNDGAGLGVGFTSLALTHCYFYNNTVYGNAATAYGVTQLSSGGTSDCTFANNDFYLLSSTTSFFINLGSAVSSMVFTGNNYYGVAANYDIDWGGTATPAPPR